MSHPTKDTEKMAALGRMTRGMIHDFNNSLASIMGYADFLVADLDPHSDQFLFAENIKKAGAQLQNSLDQIRAFSLEKGQGKDVALNVVEELAHLTDRLQSHLGTGQNMVYHSDIAAATLTLPVAQFRTLFSNFLCNAIESLEHRAGTISVTVEDAAAPPLPPHLPFYDVDASFLANEPPPSSGTPVLRITISDTGCGMDDVVLSLAPTPHFTTKASDDAKGMGLPISIGILNYLEGSLAVHSTVGAGTRLTLLLPVETLAKNPIKDGELLQTHSDPRSILLIEDRDMVRHTIVTMLERAGHSVHDAKDALTALDMLREHPAGYDLVMTDLTMPSLNGADVVTEIRHDFPELPIIVMSGDSEGLSKLGQAHSNNHIFLLPKPVLAKDLSRLITAITDSHKRN